MSLGLIEEGESKEIVSEMEERWNRLRKRGEMIREMESSEESAEGESSELPEKQEVEYVGGQAVEPGEENSEEDLGVYISVSCFCSSAIVRKSFSLIRRIS